MKVVIKDFIKTILILCLDFGILPLALKKKAEFLKLYRKLWTKKKLVFRNGYWCLSPMPDPDELNSYYSHFYWIEMGGKSSLVGNRDVDHFMTLKSFLGKNFHPKKVLNFGAGHGGISHLFFAMGCEVVIIEPSEIPLNMGWQQYSNLESLNLRDFDLIYSSHSLEHVLDLESVMRKFNSILSKDGILFFEVPNCHEQVHL